jgi:hypothetical protein
MKLSCLRNKAIKASLTIGDDCLNFTHDPSKFTVRFYQNLLGDNDESKLEGLAIFVSTVVTEWDLTDDAGSPYPLTVPALSELPIDFLNQVVGKIHEDNNPKASSSAASSYS